MPSVRAAPPRIEAGALFEGGVVRGRWQPLLVTVTNPSNGQAIEGEVQVAVEDARMGGARVETYARSLSLPPGAGRALVPVIVRLPEDAVADLTVYVADGTQIVARKRLDRLPVLSETSIVLAASETPDALAYLRGQDLGMGRRVRDRRLQNPGLRIGEMVRTTTVTPALLPERAAGYDAASIVYLADFAPDALSDAQIAALRGWVAGGGLLVVGGSRLLGEDERLRAWLPARLDRQRPPVVTPEGLTVRALAAAPGTRRIPGDPPLIEGGVGRGVVIALGMDAADAAFARRPGAAALWRQIAARGAPAGSSLIRGLEESNNSWVADSFFSAVLRAPNLRAPAFGWIGLFLLAYLVLLVPVNYAILRRLDRREWTWLTVPALVLIFSLGAYGFGYAVKGGRMRLNTASIVEMGSGEGRGALLASVGLFSPRRAAYDVGIADGDALLFGPGLTARARTDSAPLLIREGSDGAWARDADVPMWAMRVLGARTTTTGLGGGILVRLQRGPDVNIVGTLENRTGRDLDDVTVYVGNAIRNLGALPAGVKMTVRIPPGAPHAFRLGGNVLPLFSAEANGNPPQTTRARIRWSLQTAVRSLQTVGAPAGQATLAPVVVSAWSYEPLLPLRVDNRAVPEGDHVNLLLVHASLTR